MNAMLKKGGKRLEKGLKSLLFMECFKHRWKFIIQFIQFFGHLLFYQKKTFIIDLLLRYVFEVNCFRIFKQDSQVLLQATLMVAGLSGSVG